MDSGSYELADICHAGYRCKLLCIGYEDGMGQTVRVIALAPSEALIPKRLLPINASSLLLVLILEPMHPVMQLITGLEPMHPSLHLLTGFEPKGHHDGTVGPKGLDGPPGIRLFLCLWATGARYNTYYIIVLWCFPGPPLDNAARGPGPSTDHQHLAQSHIVAIGCSIHPGTFLNPTLCLSMTSQVHTVMNYLTGPSMDRGFGPFSHAVLLLSSRYHQYHTYTSSHVQPTIAITFRVKLCQIGVTSCACHSVHSYAPSTHSYDGPYLLTSAITTQRATFTTTWIHYSCIQLICLIDPSCSWNPVIVAELGLLVTTLAMNKTMSIGPWIDKRYQHVFCNLDCIKNHDRSRSKEDHAQVLHHYYFKYCLGCCCFVSSAGDWHSPPSQQNQIKNASKKNKTINDP